MNLNLFENLKKDIESSNTIKNFIEELSDFLQNSQNSNISDKNDLKTNTKKETLLSENENRKENHLYFVTEDRNGEIYLWDFTDKPKHEFKEVITSKELLDVAKEGAMLQYQNGEYRLYSAAGYNMLFNEDKN